MSRKKQEATPKPRPKPRSKAKPNDKSADECSDGIRGNRKSLTMPVGKNARNKVRYIEGTKPLKDGCWLSND